MQFKSIINYFVLVGRVLFIIACLFFLSLCLNIFPSLSNALPNNLLLRTIIVLGMIWGIITTYRGLIFRTRIILMTPTHISIHEIFRGSKKIYDIGDLKKI